MALAKLKTQHNYIRGNITLAVCSVLVSLEYIGIFTPLDLGLNPFLLAMATCFFIASLYFRLSSRRRKRDVVAILYTVVLSSLVALYYLNIIKSINLTV